MKISLLIWRFLKKTLASRRKKYKIERVYVTDIGEFYIKRKKRTKD